MSPDILRAFFRVGVFLMIVSALLAVANSPDSAEFVVSICTIGIGLMLAVLTFVIGRLTR